MAIKVGDKLPDGTLTEMIDTETPGCTIGPNGICHLVGQYLTFSLKGTAL